MSASNYLELALLDHLFGGGDFTRPASVFLALHTANPGETGASSEVAVGAYEREEVVNDGTGWDSAAAVSGLGTKKNADIIQFVDPVGANWGTITHFSIWDASSGGNCLVYGALTSSVVVNDGDPGPRFNANGLSVTLD